jgi:hypothetical protein
MKITKQTLKQIIKEEITKFLYEGVQEKDVLHPEQSRKLDAYAQEINKAIAGMSPVEADMWLTDRAKSDAASDAIDDGDLGDHWEFNYGGKYLKTYLMALQDAQSVALDRDHMYETNLNRRAKNPQK